MSKLWQSIGNDCEVSGWLSALKKMPSKPAGIWVGVNQTSKMVAKVDGKDQANWKCSIAEDIVTGWSTSGTPGDQWNHWDKLHWVLLSSEGSACEPSEVFLEELHDLYPIQQSYNALTPVFVNPTNPDEYFLLDTKTCWNWVDSILCFHLTFSGCIQY
ncbi:hypothetical protein CROQUDRAFT_133842 [Cronartium quercuum f. sp. fusiforme G11]|uniref:Uncharacterized protein n=1 Tax=Cronartium quercuum f. sp. fusiforme G11 TaxID=708437 RepID=A0A9P6TB52_9BASI|nr:hypothetical protein CROQUDRAFT_133842 [Cronartium quercuum f. sp. fusiforme G11]